MGRVPTTTTLTTLVADRSNPNVLFTASRDGVFKTTDRGLRWQAVNRGLDGAAIAALAIDPRNPKVLFAASDQGMIFKTTDGGASWRRQN